MEFFTSLIDLIGNLVWVVVIIIGALVVLAAVKGGAIRKMSRQPDADIMPDKHGLLRMHPSTIFVMKSPLSRVRKLTEPSATAADKKAVLKEQIMGAAGKATKSLAVLEYHSGTAGRDENPSRRFAQMVDELLLNKERWSGVLVRIYSPGGSVIEYGYLYEQMMRIKNSGLRVTVAVDKIAASGGYMMAAPADEIIAAPTAVIGSIGVVASLLNFHGTLQRIGVDPKLYTAGDLKRTITATNEITEEQERHFKDQLEAVHRSFKAMVAKHRDGIDIDAVANGDHWSAQETMDKGLGLVDRLGISQDFIMEAMQDQPVVFIKRIVTPSSRLAQVLSAGVAKGIEMAIGRLETRLATPFHAGEAS